MMNTLQHVMNAFTDHYKYSHFCCCNRVVSLLKKLSTPLCQAQIALTAGEGSDSLRRCYLIALDVIQEATDKGPAIQFHSVTQKMQGGDDNNGQDLQRWFYCSQGNKNTVKTKHCSTCRGRKNILLEILLKDRTFQIIQLCEQSASEVRRCVLNIITYCISNRSVYME